MVDPSTRRVAPLARWSSRIALFAASLLAVGLLLHRLASFPTPVALNLFLVAAAGLVLAMLIALIAFAQIWRGGHAGSGSAALGVLLPLAILAWPLTFVPAMLKLPPINDITTDISAPPTFTALAKQRPRDANAAVYPGERFATLQQKAYPDLRTFIMDRSADEAFELVEETVRKLRWKVVTLDPPVGRPARNGTLEATDTTLVIGFVDDISIRVDGGTSRSRIDVRSASRYGVGDLGMNADRVRRFLSELQLRADQTAPAAVARRRGLRTTRAGALLKKAKARDRQKAEGRSSRERVQSSSQRVPVPREKRH